MQMFIWVFASIMWTVGLLYVKFKIEKSLPYWLIFAPIVITTVPAALYLAFIFGLQYVTGY